MPATAIAVAATRSRTSSGTSASIESRARRAASALELLGGGRVVRAGGARCGAPSRSGSRRGSRGSSPAADHELGAAAADVDHERRLAVAARAGGGAEEGQPRLLVARDRAGVDPEALAQLVAELLAVGGVAHRAGGHGDDALGAVARRSLAVARASVVEHALHRGVGEAAARVDALAEPGDLGPPLELAHRPVLHLGHEQPGGVRPEVDHGDAFAHARHRRIRRVFGMARGSQRTSRPADARGLEDLVLKDLEGRDVRLGERWSRNPALLVFLRHYG